MNALDAKFAVNYLQEISEDVRAVTLLDSEGRVEASTTAGIASRMPGIVDRLFERGERVSGAGLGQPTRVEVATPDGEVFCLRSQGRTLVAITGRFTLSSLMFYDMLTVLGRLEPGTDGNRGLKRP